MCCIRDVCTRAETPCPSHPQLCAHPQLRQGFPTLIFFPAEKDAKPIPYEGGRTLGVRNLTLAPQTVAALRGQQAQMPRLLTPVGAGSMRGSCKPAVDHCVAFSFQPLCRRT